MPSQKAKLGQIDIFAYTVVDTCQNNPLLGLNAGKTAVTDVPGL